MKRNTAIVEASAVVLIIIGAAVAVSMAFPLWSALFSLAAVLMVLAVVYPFVRLPYSTRLGNDGTRNASTARGPHESSADSGEFGVR